MVLMSRSLRVLCNVMHGLEYVCHEAGNGENNGRRCPIHALTVFLPDPNSINHSVSWVTKVMGQTIKGGWTNEKRSQAINIGWVVPLRMEHTDATLCGD
jgi:hypothetical protein